MEYRIQRIFLTLGVAGLSLVASSLGHAQEAPEADDDVVEVEPVIIRRDNQPPINGDDSVQASDLNSEVFELGVFTGILNIGDFTSEWLLGVSAGFHASEDFFIQYNYLQADADLSSFERSQGSFFSGSDRKFVHYDLLVGYNLFQGEMYPRAGLTNLSSLYIIAGVGDTEFGDEESFTYTLGLGYQIAFARRYVLHLDYRNYIYESALIRGDEKTTQNAQFSLGLNYLF